MKKLIIVVVLVLCSGCYQVVNKYELEAAENFCSDKGGVYDIREWSNGDTFVECMEKTAKFPHGKLVDKAAIKIKAEHLQGEPK